MKKFLILALTLSSLQAFANPTEPDFQEMKTNIVNHFDKKIAQLQEGKTCVSAAKDKEGLKACRMKMRDSHKAMKKDWEAKRDEFRAKKEKNKNTKK